MRARTAFVLITSIFILGLLLRVYPLEAYHGWDESTYLQHAEHIITGKDNYNELAFRPPLLPLIFAAGFLLWHSAFMASILTALLSASIIIALYLLGRRIHSDEAGLLAALLVAVHPAFVEFGHLLLTDAIVASFLAFALYYAHDHRWQLILLCGACTGLAALTKFTALATVPLLALYVFWREHEMTGKWRILFPVAFSAGFLVTFGPYLLWAQQRYGNFIIVFQKAQAIVNNVSGGPFYYAHPFVFTIPVLLGVVLYFWQWRRVRDTPFFLLTLAWLISIIGYLNTFPAKDYRYALAAIVPLLMIAGIGYGHIARKYHKREWLRFILPAIIILLSIQSFATFLHAPVEHWKIPAHEMAERITALNNSSMIIYATSDYPIYGYYTENQVIVVDGPNFLNAYPRIMPRDGYLLVYKGRDRDPTEEWAQQQKQLLRITENEAIILYEYKRKR